MAFSILPSSTWLSRGPAYSLSLSLFSSSLFILYRYSVSRHSLMRGKREPGPKEKQRPVTPFRTHPSLPATGTRICCSRIRGRELSGEEEPERGGKCEFSGSVFGAVSLIIGTSIGSGMLALPQKMSHTVRCPPHPCS